MTATEPEPRQDQGSTDAVASGPSRGRRDWLALAAILAVAAGLRLFWLDQNGTGSEYYAATIRSMMANGHNALYAAFDPAGFLGVDKPPLAFWVQALSAKLFGYHGLSLLVPQAVEGVLTVGLAFLIVRRAAGLAPAVAAGLVLAVTPVSVALDRENLPDTCLVLCLVIATIPLLKAVESGRARWFVLAMALVGVAFNAKMMAAVVVLPAFVMAYVGFAPVGVWSRARGLALGLVMFAVVGLAWATMYDLTPPDRRPYVGDTSDNSMFSLMLGWNGMSRLAGPGPGGPGGSDAAAKKAFAKKAFAKKGMTKKARLGRDGVPLPPERDPADAFGSPVPPGPPSPLRFLHPRLTGQIAWLLPLAVIGGVVALRRGRWSRPLDRETAAALVFAVWLVTVWGLISFSGGVIHPYYTVLMAPPLACLVGLGLKSLWDSWREGGMGRWLLPASMLATALASAGILLRDGATMNVTDQLIPIGIGTGIALIGLTSGRGAGRVAPERSIAWGRFAMGLGLAALLVGPIAWSLTCVRAPGFHSLPGADPMLLEMGPPNGPGGGLLRPNSPILGRMVAYLRREREGERFLLAVPDIHAAAPFIVAFGEPVMAVGGFLGTDPTLSAEQFASRVAAGEVRFVLASTGSFGPTPPGWRPHPAIEWAREHGTPVDPEPWQLRAPGGLDRGQGSPVGPSSRITLFDCRPRAEPNPAPAPAPSVPSPPAPSGDPQP